MTQNQTAREEADRINQNLWRKCGFKSDHLVDAIATALIAAREAGRAEGWEDAARIALEQRCQRGTPWDLACTTVAAAIRALKEPRT